MMKYGQIKQFHLVYHDTDIDPSAIYFCSSSILYKLQRKLSGGTSKGQVGLNLLPVCS